MNRVSIIKAKCSGDVYPTVSGMFTVVAPHEMAVSTILHKKSTPVRPASSAENSTSSQYFRAKRTPFFTRSMICSSVFLSFFSVCIVEVPTNVWIRGRSENFTALAQAIISFSTILARPQITGPVISLAIIETASKSPGEDTGKPASITSTLRRAS